MPTLKTLFFLNAYEDNRSSNQPQRQDFRWTRDITNSVVSNALSETFLLAPGATQLLFSGTRTLAQDNSTEYSIASVSGASSTYQLTNVGGTSPAFRAHRDILTDATSQVTTSINGTVLTFTFTGGTLPDLLTVIPGDQVLIGNVFNPSNQGIWQIISLTSTSFSIVNATGIAQGPITLGSSFANQLRVFSGTGVQIGDTLTISGGFSPVSQNSYDITQVTDYYVQFSWAGILPTEGPITTESISIYSMAKSMIYMETDQDLQLNINGQNSGPTVIPPVSNGVAIPGILMLNSTIYSLSVTNQSITQAKITLLSTE